MPVTKKNAKLVGVNVDGIEKAIKEKKAEKKSIKPTAKKSVPAKLVKKIENKQKSVKQIVAALTGKKVGIKTKPNLTNKSVKVILTPVKKQKLAVKASLKKPSKAKNTPEFGIEAVVKGSGYTAGEVRAALRAIDYPKGGYFYNFKNQVGVDRAVAKIKKYKK